MILKAKFGNKTQKGIKFRVTERTTLGGEKMYRWQTIRAGQVIELGHPDWDAAEKQGLTKLKETIPDNPVKKKKVAKKVAKKAPAKKVAPKPAEKPKEEAKPEEKKEEPKKETPKEAPKKEEKPAEKPAEAPKKE